ncbi:D-alanyl-D-alanine carboxypeptidase [Porticoccaceae bacterium]|nr:D-alanyl-D-alanine carboxypeptidase [Porticoccaceae bacterium]MDB9970220.1 D-alanyl-D-alanine carboxypeptidase [Porticoccaceae bacterium]MDC0010387.1 D-alanyl-D-alanine carboxypeptidase [Porticoccaceae bacterium]MDC1453282.1 D-alanyl-D-alanine carboxypeptidase [Porticoccaceae bacterium]
MLKKYLVSFAAILLSLQGLSAVQAQQLIPAPPELAAKAYILIDANTGHILVENNADMPLPPASLVKMMTTYIVSNEIAAGRMSKDEMVLISDNAWEKGGAKTDGSTMFLNPRTRVSVSDLMRGVIIQSGNDASIALAEHISGDEVAFADVMNHQASLLGMDSTQYFNATGLPYEGMVSTARDLSLLARAIIQDHPEHYSIYSEKYFKYNNINQPNRNRLLWRDSSVDGLKTGHTNAAGYCLVSSAKRRDMRLISVVMGADSDKSRARETQKLLSYGFRHYDTKTIYSIGDIIKENAKVWYGKEEFLNLTIAENVTLTLPRGAQKNLSANILVDEQIKAPISAGQELGRLQVSLNDEILIDTALVAEKDIAQSGLFSRFVDWILLFITQLMS